MMNMKKNIIKIISIVIMLTFGFTPFSVGAQSVAGSANNLKQLVSENYGSIRDSYFAGGASGIIVHIQDLHCNYDESMGIHHRNHF